MERISVYPETRMQQSGGKATLGIRITMSVEAITPNDKKEIRALWEELDNNQDISKLTEVIKVFIEKRKGNTTPR